MNRPEDITLVFIAGPLVNGGYASRSWRNVAAAISTAKEVMDAGGTPIVPHLSMLSDMVEPLEEERDWAKWALDVLTKCDALVLSGAADPKNLEGGTKDEVELAHQLGVPVFSDAEGFERWLKPDDALLRYLLAELKPRIGQYHDRRLKEEATGNDGEALIFCGKVELTGAIVAELTDWLQHPDTRPWWKK